MTAARSPGLSDDALAAFRALLGERFSVAGAVRAQHSHDESWHEAALPDGVAFAASTEEVAEIVRICARHGLPIVPFGAGTGLEGGVNAVAGGIAVDLSGMNAILRISAEDLDCTVEAGVTRQRLNEELRATGLFFPIDPGAECTLGGMAATRASGTNAVRYGTMREMVLGLTVVLADGRIVHTGGRARKSAAGYDLTRLFVGSEGTLGIITEVTLRLVGIPEAVSAAVCAFETLDGAVDTVIQTIQLGIPIARIELLDEAMMDAINRRAALGRPVAPTLFFEFHGTGAWVREQAEMVGALAGENGGLGFDWAAGAEERARLWDARHQALYASAALRPGCKVWSSDVCVPISRLADCIRETKADLAGAPMPTTLVGHVGDGNFHVAFMIDPDDPGEVEETRRLNARLVERAVAMGGTCTGEHGIGLGKMESLRKEAGDALGAMADIKRALDPLGLLNPGKILRM
jgi:D-lactate dehydrogenase (cytochrome)